VDADIKRSVKYEICRPEKKLKAEEKVNVNIYCLVEPNIFDTEY